MKQLSWLVAVLAMLCGVGASAQTEMGGEWTVSFASPSGPQEFTMYVIQEGPRLTGRFTSESGEFPLRGRLDGSEFVINWSLPDAGKMLDITFAGTVMGETLSGTAKLGTRGTGPLSGTRVSQ